MISALEGSQYLVHKWLLPIATQVTQDVKPQIIDTLLMLIFRIEQ